MNVNIAPKLAILGICDRAGRSTNVHPQFSKLNILGLRCDVISHIYPVPLKYYQLVFAVYDIETLEDVELKCISDSRGFVCTFKLGINPIDTTVSKKGFYMEEGVIMSNPKWTILTIPFPDHESILEPDILRIFIQNGHEPIELGLINFHYVAAAPLTPDRIAAIRSDPNACKWVSMDLQCPKCKACLNIYTGIDKSDKQESEGYHWYKNLPDYFACECPSKNIPLIYIKESLHCLLGRNIRSSDEQQFTFINQYELSTLIRLLEKFEHLLDSNPSESDMQLFIEKNPIILHRFTADRIMKKAPILNKYETDFAIFSQNSDLFLIEIEHPGKPILKKSGGRTAEFNQAFDQVTDWLNLVSDHRSACLEMMGLKSDKVSSIRGVVIYGREKGVESNRLRKLKSMDFGNILFFTYDDIANGLSTLIRDMRNM